MFSILFHIIALAILEIIFYFEYIGPMETEMFKNTFKTIVMSIINSIDNDKLNDINQLINTFQMKGQLYHIIFDSNSTSYQENKLYINSKISEYQRNNFNNNIYYNCILYWSIIFISVLILYFIYKFIIKNKINNKEINETNGNFELVDNNSVTHNSIHEWDESSVTYNRNFISNIFSKILKIKKNKSIKVNVFYYLTLAGLIIFFEYLFFNFVVMKYKILTGDEIKYISFIILEPWLINTFF